MSVRARRGIPRRPLIGVGVIIVENGEALLVRRANDPGRGLWSVPGGKLEWGESLEEAARREALEETGLVVRVERIAGVSEVRVPDGAANPEFHYVLVDFFCRAVSGEPSCAGDAEEIGWFSLDEIERIPATAGLAAKLREWINDGEM